ncbi:MAG: XRE family transcriptional regulator [Rhodospirillales bacterium]|nr:XRE family transcriptional regulator [Rhodospirillales bacterium]
MGRNLEAVIAALPASRRARIEARYQTLQQEVEGLGELRRVTGKAQAEIAARLGIRQPSVSKIEKQADMYLSTLRSYVEAVGGALELVVRLPAHPPLRLEKLGDAGAAIGKTSRPQAAPRSVAAKIRARG